MGDSWGPGGTVAKPRRRMDDLDAAAFIVDRLLGEAHQNGHKAITHCSILGLDGSMLSENTVGVTQEQGGLLAEAQRTKDWSRFKKSPHNPIQVTQTCAQRSVGVSATTPATSSVRCWCRNATQPTPALPCAPPAVMSGCNCI